LSFKTERANKKKRLDFQPLFLLEVKVPCIMSFPLVLDRSISRKVKRRTHQMDTPYDKFSAAMDRLVPMAEGDLVALAVSGGPDSMALLHLVCAWAKGCKTSLRFVALTVDHGLRPESAEEALKVEEWASALGFDHFTLHWDDEKPVSNIEAEAREARYTLLRDWCLEHGATSLMTAHHLDDQAETFLMRLVRGSGVGGLRAMSESRLLDENVPGLELFRPLLDVSKSDLIGLLREVKQPWFNDPTNDDESFTRAKVRSLKDVFGDLGLNENRIVATAKRMTLANEVLAAAEEGLWGRAVEITKFGELRLKKDDYAETLEDTRLRVLARALKGVSGSSYGPRYDRLKRLDLSICGGEEKGGSTLHGCRIQDVDGQVLFWREQRRADEAVLEPCGDGALWDGRFLLQALNVKALSQGGREIRTLGDDGFKFLKAEDWQPSDGAAPWPRREVLLALPSMWEGKKLVSSPLIGYNSSQFKAHFTLFS
jgi:tRNA(Ile)-lysidine synthase